MSIVSIPLRSLKQRGPLADGLKRQHAGDKEAAFAIYAKIIETNPKNAAAWFLMGTLWEAVKEPRRALECFDAALKIRPSFVEAHYNRAWVISQMGDLDGALKGYERAIKCDKNFAPAYVNLGNMYLAQGDYDRAYQLYDRAKDFKSRDAETTFNQGFVNFLRDEWEEGWKKYEARWLLPGHLAANPFPDCTPWEGQSLDGKRVLVFHEQGAGDTFMCLRYVRGLQAMGAKPIIRVEKSMIRLMAANFPDCELNEFRVKGVNGATETVPFPECDFAFPLMSLPRLFNTTHDSIPLSDRPYLKAPTTGPILPPSDRFKVGFVWKGSKDHKGDMHRSTQLSQWAGLLSLPGIQWYAMQYEMAAPERQALQALPNVSLPTGITDWGDTAYALTQLDCLLSIDTGIIHLAGAMGVTTCTIIGALPDFRWRARGTNPGWYHNMLLYRQPKYREWGPVFQELGARLRAVVETKEAA